MRRIDSFVETVLFALKLLAIVENAGASAVLLHDVGAMLVASRILHPFGHHNENGKTVLRIVSGPLTVAVFALASGCILWAAFSLLVAEAFTT